MAGTRSVQWHMAEQRYSFDVETRHGNRWVFDGAWPDQYQARKSANTHLANPKCEGARIIRTWKRPDGVPVDTEIFCQLRESRDDGVVRISPVESVSGTCQTLRDFVGFDSRQAMSRIFREYLARAVVTPTEIIYTLRHLKRINDKDGLVRAAVDMVATLQTREGGQDMKTRRDEIYRAVDDMVEHARTLEPAALPKLDPGFGAVMGSLGRTIDRDRRNDLMLAALSRDLGERPSWVGKLELLCDMASAEGDTEALELLDGVIADVLGTDVIQDILGLQPSLGATICALLDLADGIAPTTRTNTGEVTAALCRLLAEGKLPASRRCIIERAHRALRLPTPLKPNEREQDPVELRKIIARVVTPGGLHSGADTAHALTIRFTRMVEEGGKTGRRAALKGVFLAMPDLAYGVIYLCDAGRSDFAREHLADMEALLVSVLQAAAFGAFCDPSLTPHERMARATAAYHAVAISPYPSATRTRVMAHIDALLERFVIEERIVDQLDQPDTPLRERALRLVRFCDSGLLPKGRALQQAHKRVLALLKQPDFPARFVAGINDPQAAQTALRDFFALLQSSGVHGG
jgi:hypothetical protein